MEFSFEGNRIVFDRQLSNLDLFVQSFVDVLDSSGIRYVIVSGYVSILFGRSRETEDVDLFMESVSFKQFSQFWETLSSQFECINAGSAQEAFREYLSNHAALRFAQRGSFIPNMEVKFPKNDLDGYTLKNRLEVVLNGKPLFVSPLELQIAFKLFSGFRKRYGGRLAFVAFVQGLPGFGTVKRNGGLIGCIR